MIPPRYLPVFRWFAGTLCAALVALATPADAAGFALAISPPRFEIEIKPGDRIRQVLEINNAADSPNSFKVKTADWSLAPDGSVLFEEALVPGSCRPWVALERRNVTVPARRPYRYRFEITVPADTKPTECRFALLLEGEDQAATTGALSIPYNARLAVIVYAAVGAVEPKIEIVTTSVQMLNGKFSAVLRVKNTGTAHGRLSGFLSGTDASNTALEFTPTPSPILAGETRDIALVASRPGDPDTPVQPTFPVTVRGKLEWGKNDSQALEQRFAP